MAKNWKSPEGKAAFSEGWAANANYEKLNTCPYEKGTYEAKCWCAGWYEANEDPTLQSEKSGECAGQWSMYY